MAFRKTSAYYQQGECKMKLVDVIGFSIFTILSVLVVVAVWFAL